MPLFGRSKRTVPTDDTTDETIKLDVKVKDREIVNDTQLNDASQSEFKGNNELTENAKRLESEYTSFVNIGKLHFQNTHQGQEGLPYIKMTHDVNIEDFVHQIMHHQWNMSAPKIVLFLISNVSPLSNWSNERQLINFQRGIMNAADSTKMWIFTHGFNTGVTSLIGDTLQKRVMDVKASRKRSNHKTSELNVIGIAREDMLRYGEHIGNDKMYDATVYNDGGSLDDQKYELNTNLTNYILIRDGTVGKTGVNVFISRLAQFFSAIGGNEIRRTAIEHDTCTLKDIEIPVVSVLIQGGYECARIVLDQIRRQIPIVVIRGSGGLADLIAYVAYEVQHRCFNVWDAEFVESNLKPELSIKISVHFTKLRDNPLSRNIFRDRILECVRLSMGIERNYLTVLNMHNAISCNLENLTEYLLMALFKSQRNDLILSSPKNGPNFMRMESYAHDKEMLRKDLHLCLDWNCPDVARKEVLAKDSSNVLNLEKGIFEEALTRSNRTGFVDLFLSHGFRLRTFLSPSRLKRLYRKLHNREFFRTVCWERILGKSSDTKQSNVFLERELNWLIDAATGISNFMMEEELNLFVMNQFPKSEAEAERKSLAMVVMWAVFDFKRTLVKVLWKHSDQPIHLALIIALMYERLAEYVTEQSVHKELIAESKAFKQYANDVLEECYNDDPERADDVLNEVSADWNYKTAVDIAAYSKSMTFISHSCCQKWITIAFYGRISFRDLRHGIHIPSFIKIILCALFIFPMYIWIRFTDPSKKDDDEDVEDDDEIVTDGIFSNPSFSKRKDKRSESHGTGAWERRREMLKNITRYGNVFNHNREFIIKNQPPLWKMIYIFWNAPITKFWVFQYFYILYLGIFSIAVLSPNCGNYYLDFTICVWTSLIVADLLRRTYLLYKNYTTIPILFKIIEITLLIIFVIIYSYGRIMSDQFSFVSPYHEKVIMCIGLLYSFYRLIAIYLPISPTLGPLWYRLKIMVMVDFLNFLRMALLVMISSGIVIQAVLYPDRPFSAELFRQTFHRTFFSLFMTPADELEPDNQERCSKSTYDPIANYSACHAGQYTDYTCANTGVWPYVFMIMYFVLLKLILMTLLYAIFASSATRLTSDTDTIWKFQRYILVVDFLNRLPLPPPLNIFCYIYFVIRGIYRIITCYRCRKQSSSSIPQTQILLVGDPNEKRQVKLLEEGDYNYMKVLAENCYNKEKEKHESEMIYRKQWERVITNSEEIEYEKRILRQLKGKASELERMMRNSQAYLETIKHLSGRDHGFDSAFASRKALIHYLERYSPYPNTNVQRFPVPDKYVPWEVLWIDYDPPAYTKPKYEFTLALQQYADEDILLLQSLQMDETQSKLPVFHWNLSSTNPAGITTDRRSWELTDEGTNLVYKLENGIPRNPFGRTGLRGRGALPRWGPNHYIILIITRWHSYNSTVLEFMIQRTEKRETFTLPERFISGECAYEDFQLLFRTNPQTPNWTSVEHMTEFFRNCLILKSPLDSPSESTSDDRKIVGLKYEKILQGYLDDPLNTDHAWKEADVCHFHFTEEDNLNTKVQSPLIQWRIMSEDVFIKLPLSHASIMQGLNHKLHPEIV